MRYLRLDRTRRAMREAMKNVERGMSKRLTVKPQLFGTPEVGDTQIETKLRMNSGEPVGQRTARVLLRLFKFKVQAAHLESSL